MNIILTGSNGFLGSHLLHSLNSKNHKITSIQRDTPFELLRGEYDYLIHLAAKAHSPDYHNEKARHELFESNVEYTKKIARLAKNLNVKRFVFVSSVKVHGSGVEKPFTENDLVTPNDLYSITKLLAENEVKSILANSQTEYTIIRPPLIYGANAKANIWHLIQLCKLPIPLPFGTIVNKRSLISLENLNNFIELCCHHPNAANQTFLISDDHDISTTELIRTIKTSLGRKPMLLPIPQIILNVIFKIMGKQGLSERLLGNLQVDITKAKHLLNWKPPISFEEGIKLMVKEYVD